MKNNGVKLPRGLAGVPVGGVETEIDARWPMAYAAGLGDTDPAYLDTLRPGGIVSHPLFPVCYEWPLAVKSRARQLGDEGVDAAWRRHPRSIEWGSSQATNFSTLPLTVSKPKWLN